MRATGHLTTMGTSMTRIWGLWVEGVSILVESFMGAVRPMQVLNALIVANLLTLYTIGRDAAVGRLVALWAVSSGSILLWAACAVVLHEAGL